MAKKEEGLSKWKPKKTIQPVTNNTSANPNRKEIPQKTLIEAAQLAAQLRLAVEAIAEDAQRGVRCDDAGIRGLVIGIGIGAASAQRTGKRKETP